MWWADAHDDKFHLYPITMAMDSISGGNKSHARRLQCQQEFVALSYNTTLCMKRNNKIVTQGLYCCHGKGVQISYNQ